MHFESNQVYVYSLVIMALCGITKENVSGVCWVEFGTVTSNSYKFRLSRRNFPALKRLKQEYISLELSRPTQIIFSTCLLGQKIRCLVNF